MKKYEDNPLVSVIVVTYNSSKYILDTLESIKSQTYSNLSLIITDDCSTDKTVNICRDWVENNKERFVETKILESPINTGVSANCNRGQNACTTEWVKGIAGDDILCPNCIEDNIKFVKKTPNAIFVFSKLIIIGKKNQVNKFDSPVNYSFFSLSSEEQFNQLIFNGNCLPAPSLFYNCFALRRLGLVNDERIPMLEDWPKWINALKLGIKFYYMDVETVMYRVHAKSLSTSLLMSPRLFRSLRLFYYYYIREEQIKVKGIDKIIEEDVSFQSDWYSKFYTYRNLFSSKVYFLLTHIFPKFR